VKRRGREKEKRHVLFRPLQLPQPLSPSRKGKEEKEERGEKIREKKGDNPYL